MLDDMKSGLVVAGWARLELLVLARELDEVGRQDLQALGLFLRTEIKDLPVLWRSLQLLQLNRIDKLNRVRSILRWSRWPTERMVR